MFRPSHLTYAFRTLRRSPLFTLTVVLSLAFGIAGNAAIFSIVNALFLHPAGVKDAAQVVAPRVSYRKLKLDNIDISTTDFADVRASKQIFSAAALMSNVSLNYAAADVTQHLQGAAITWQWFDVFGARPLLGRTFTADDDQPGSKYSVVLSYDIWKRLFGSQRDALGRTVELNHKTYRVVGVMPADFRWPTQADVWIPLGLASSDFAIGNRFNEFYEAVARLRPGVTLEQCGRFMQLLTKRAKSQDRQVAAYANASQWSMGVQPFTELASGELRPSLLLLAASVGLVLLIACSNIAGLMLVRGSGRARDLAVRRAVGATTVDLIGQTMTESLLLSCAGTALGLLSISALLSLLLRFAPARMTSGLVVETDKYVLLFTVAVGIAAALMFGIIPALQAARLGTHYEFLKEGGRSDTESRGRQRVRGALVLSQVALALVLLLGAASLLKSLARLHSTNLGFDPKHLMTAAVDLPDPAYTDDTKKINLFRGVLERLREVPGVISAAAAEPVPFNGDHWTASFSVEGRPELPGDPGPHGYQAYVSPSYFSAMKIPLVSGRDFNDGDRAGSVPVAIVDENLARAYWPGGNAIGHKLRRADDGPWETVIGIVKHVRAYNFNAGDIRGTYYHTILQNPVGRMNFVVRTSGNTGGAKTMIANAVRSEDHAQAVFDVATPEERIEKALGPQQFAMQLLSTFAAAALLLAALGLYGVVSFSATRRTREIGIRSALGASRWHIISTVAGDGLRLVGIGVVVGSLAALGLLRAVRANFEMAPLDSTSFAGAVVLLSLVALAASFYPAWRATAVDPLTVLRNE